MTLRILVLLLLWPAGSFAQDLVTPSDRVTTHVNIRAAAEDGAAQIGQLDIGEGLPLVRRVPRWYEVQLPNGQTGFVTKAFTTVSRALVPRQPDELRIHFLNIGAGSCAIVECPGANSPPMIVDCGSTGATAVDMNAQQTRAYIQNVLALHPGTSPNVVLSHPDLDHYAHIPTALDNASAASVWQGGDTDAYSSANFPAWLAAQQTGGAVLHRNFPAHPQQSSACLCRPLLRGGIDVCADRQHRIQQ